MVIVVHVEDGLKFGCIDFSSQQQKKKEGALHTDRPVFEFPNHTAEFPNQPTCMVLRLDFQPIKIFVSIATPNKFK